MKPTLVVIHGVNGSAAEMAPVIAALRQRFDIHAPDLLGHGGREVPDGYTLEEMAEDLVRWLDREQIGRAYFLGYSLGGYLALYLARFYPERVRGVIGLIVKHVFDEASIAHITYLANPERLARPGNPRKGELERAHGADNWIAVTNNSARLFQSFGQRPPLGDDDLKAIQLPVLLMAGDQDSVVPVDHTRALAGLLPQARLGLFRGPAHPLKNVPLTTTIRAAKDFIADVEARGFVPGRELDLTPRLLDQGGIGLTIRPRP